MLTKVDCNNCFNGMLEDDRGKICNICKGTGKVFVELPSAFKHTLSTEPNNQSPRVNEDDWRKDR